MREPVRAGETVSPFQLDRPAHKCSREFVITIPACLRGRVAVARSGVAALGVGCAGATLAQGALQPHRAGRAAVERPLLGSKTSHRSDGQRRPGRYGPRRPPADHRCRQRPQPAGAPVDSAGPGAEQPRGVSPGPARLRQRPARAHRQRCPRCLAGAGRHQRCPDRACPGAGTSRASCGPVTLPAGLVGRMPARHSASQT